MDSVPGSRSGGKILRPRRAPAARTTPYSRPSPPSPRSPNWLSRFVVSPTRFFASGAGKILSTVLDLNSPPTTSSSSYDTFSLNSSHTDSSASEEEEEEEVDTFNDENDAGNNTNMRAIEQLVMQETFSREECNRLIKLIRSRVVVSTANHDVDDESLRNVPIRIFGSDTASPDLCSAAVMEAKKWLQEKKSGLDSNTDLGYGSHNLNFATSPQASKDGGSPVDLARSYMRTLPPWSSPSSVHIKPPSPVGIQLFKDEEPNLFGGSSTTSSKLKRDSLVTRSWSIQDEIRRVRSRATEEMLRTLPSTKIDWSAISMEYKKNVNSSVTENKEATLGEKVQDYTNLVDASSNLARGLGAQASPDLESKPDGFRSESVPSDPAMVNAEQNQGSGAVQQTKGSQDDCGGVTTSVQREGSTDDMNRDGSFVKVNGINNSNEANHQLHSVEGTAEALSSRLHDGNSSELKEKAGADDPLANGFPSSAPSVKNTKTLDKEASATNLTKERTSKGVVEQKTCKLSSESVEVPDHDTVATASQNSSSVQYEAQPGSESEAAATPTSIAKRKGKRITARYNRRGRGSSVL